MNCCNDWGQCTGKGDCPARHTAPKPAPQANPFDPIPEPETWEVIAFYGGVAVVTVLSIVLVGIGVGAAYARWLA